MPVGAGSGPGGTDSGSLEVPGFGSDGAVGKESGFDFLAGGELRLSCSKSEPKEAFFLSLLDLLGGSFPFSPSFPLFPIRKPQNNNTNQERCCLVSYILVSAFQNGCLFILEGKTSSLEEFHLDLHGSGNFLFFTNRLE